MAEISSSVKKMHFVEIVLMLSTFVGALVKFIFGYQPTFFIEIFTIGLALVYFPFGFYFIGKPAENYSKNISVILGFVYALGVLTILLGIVNIDSYRYPLIADFFVLAAVIIFMLFKMRSADYPQVYINAQFLRVAFIVITSLIILVK